LEDKDMILVTGGLGFIGAHTVRALLDLGQQCVVVSRTARKPPDFLAEASMDDLKVERADCTDLAGLLEVGKRHEITGVVHLAAAPLSHGSSLDNLEENVLAFFTVARAARQWGVSRVVQASSIGVYGGVTASVYSEDLPLPVPSQHALQAYKKGAEIFASAIDATEGLQIASVRIGAIWGPLGRERSPFFAAPQLIHTAAHRDVEPLNPVPFAGDGIDMLYAADCGRAIALLQTARVLNYQAYNVGSGHVTTNQEVAEAIVRTVDVPAPVLNDGRSAAAPAADAYLDTGRLHADTGFEPRHDLDAAVADYVQWLRAGHTR
jgi:UDP-glucose 4-epimerase